MTDHCRAEVIEDRSSLLGAGGNHGPDAFAPSSAGRPTSSLGDSPLNGDKAKGLFHDVVGGVDVGFRDKSKIAFGVLLLYEVTRRT